jgi:uncharacterized protein
MGMSGNGLAIEDRYRVQNTEELEALYGESSPAARLKEIDYISDNYRVFVEKSPFVLLATSGPDGIDCSPRGDPAGFVRIADDKTLLIPDRRGNNRLDSLRNLVADPRAALLFLVPGVGETLRVNGRGYIVTEPGLLASFKMQGKIPASVIMFKVESVYFQCPKALVRSRLWSPDAQVVRSELPSSGQILQEIMQSRDEAFDGSEYDRNYPERLRQTIY